MIPFSQILFEDNDYSKNLRNNFIKKQKENTINNKKDCYENLLKEVFFSDENIEIINRRLIMNIYKLTNKKVKINEQSKESLNIVMTYVFTEYSNNFDIDIQNQIKELNCKVANELTPKILTEVNQHITYVKNIDKIKLLDLPVNSLKNRTLPSVTTTFR